MSYVAKTLAPGEEILYSVRFHWMTKLGAFLALILLFWLIIGIVIFFRIMIQVWTTEIVVTNDRLAMKEGWIARKTEQVSLDKIEEVQLTQSFWGRIFGFGKVHVRGTGEGNIETPIIDDPLGLVRAIQSARTNYQGDGEVSRAPGLAGAARLSGRRLS